MRPRLTDAWSGLLVSELVRTLALRSSSELPALVLHEAHPWCIPKDGSGIRGVSLIWAQPGAR